MFNPKKHPNPWGRRSKGRTIAARFLRPVGSVKYGVADSEGKIIGGPFFCKRDARAEKNRLNGNFDGGPYHICPYKE